MLLNCVEILNARESMVSIKVAEYPYLKPEGMRKTFKDLNKLAYPLIINEEAKALTTADLAKILKG